MTLVLLVPGVLMGAGMGSGPVTPVTLQAVHWRHGVYQPDVPTVNGPGTSGG